MLFPRNIEGDERLDVACEAEVELHDLLIFRVEEKPHHGHEHVVGHGLHAQGIGGVDVDDGLVLVHHLE